MIVYFALPILVFFGYVIAISKEIEKTISYFLYTLIFLILVIFAGLRGDGVSRDYENYVSFFFQINSGGSVAVINDPGFYFIIRIVSFFSNTYILLFIIYAFLGVYAKLFSFVRIMGITGAFLATIIYLSNFYFLHEMTQIRIGVASGIFLIGIPFIVKRQFKKYLICILIASFFHISVILVLPLYFLRHDRINRVFWIGLLVINLIFFISHLSIMDIIQVFTPASLSDKVRVYKSLMMEATDTTNIRFFNRFLLYLILNLFLLYHSKFLAQKSIYFIFLLKTSFISLSIAFFLYDFYLFAYRFSEIIGVVQICLFAMIAYLFKDKILGSFIVLLLALFLILINIGFTGLLQPYYFHSF